MRRLCWLGVATALCAALGCGGRTTHDADPTPNASGGESGSASDSQSGGASGANDGAGGLHSIILACDICSFPELVCSGAQFPEPQSTVRSYLGVYDCDYAPSTGAEQLEFHVDCKDGPPQVTCQVGYCNRIVASGGAIHFENSDGTDAFVCRAPRSVR
ncbi:MAG: hypothetical protein ABJB12_02075 [Pseudomonadota bacterium]